MNTQILENLLKQAESERQNLSENHRDRITPSLFKQAEEITKKTITKKPSKTRRWDAFLDKLLTSKITGFPVMLLILAGVFWLTIAGANVPGEYLATALFWFGDQLGAFMSWMGAPAWLKGFLVDGVYLGLAWVVSVMLPPMAIFFLCKL